MKTHSLQSSNDLAMSYYESSHSHHSSFALFADSVFVYDAKLTAFYPSTLCKFHHSRLRIHAVTHSLDPCSENIDDSAVTVVTDKRISMDQQNTLKLPNF